MNEKLINNIESGLRLIGDKIQSWREDEDSRAILEPKAFKTKADIEANKLIKRLLIDLDPNVEIISEEDPSFNNERPQKYWLIDPIDGTASWYDGFDGFVTQVAYIENDISVYGAIYAPVLGKFWSAKKGEGAFLNGEKLPKLKSLPRLNLIDNYPEPKRVAKTIFDNLEVTKYIECGSLGLKSCLVADGTADLFVKDVVIRDWDIAPADVILREVNAVIKNLNAHDITYEGKYEKTNGLIVARDEVLLDAALYIINKNKPWSNE